MKKRIICYGDSNTWGNDPASGTRFPENVRWTGIASSLLGEDYVIVEEGLNGRTTCFDDYYVDCRNGKKGLGYALCAHAPIDLIVISLGTNDLKFTDAIGASKGLSELLRLIKHADACFPAALSSVYPDVSIFPNGTKMLVISPINLHHEIARLRPESSIADKHAESLKFATYFERVARQHDAAFLNAALYAEPSVIDCVHMDADSHLRLGTAVAEIIRTIFGDESR